MTQTCLLNKAYIEKINLSMVQGLLKGIFYGVLSLQGVDNFFL